MCGMRAESELLALGNGQVKWTEEETGRVHVNMNNIQIYIYIYIYLNPLFYMLTEQN